MARLDAWLRSVLWEGTLPGSSPSAEHSPDPVLTIGDFDIHRLKALVPVIDEERSRENDHVDSHNGVPQTSRTEKEKSVRMKMIQGVRDIFEITSLPDPSSSERSGGDGGSAGAITREGKLVLIGRGLGEASVWQRSLDGSIQ